MSLNESAIIGVGAGLLNRAVEFLSMNAVSFGVDIVSVDVGLIMANTPQGQRPAWMVVYQSKGKLIGPENHILQMTLVTDPFISDENFKTALYQGCEMILNERNKQGSIFNGNGKQG